jgi:ferric enterobactin receptor
MKALFVSFLLVIFYVNVQAQVNPAAKGKISGKVTDATNKQPVDYATISVYKQGNASPFNGISTDIKGNFTVDRIPPGEYKVQPTF